MARNDKWGRQSEAASDLAFILESQDPVVANFVARHEALRKRVTELERAIEQIRDAVEDDWLSREARTGVHPRHEIRRLLRVLDA